MGRAYRDLEQRREIEAPDGDGRFRRDQLQERPRTGTSACWSLPTVRASTTWSKSAGSGTLEKSLRAVRVGGRVSLIGILAGGSGINPMPVLFKSVCLQGIYVGSRDMFDEMDHAMEINGISSGNRSHLPVRSNARSIQPSGKRGPFRQGLHPNLSGDESAIPDEVLCYGRGRAWCATLNSITQAWGGI